MTIQVAGLCEHRDDPSVSPKHRNCLNASFSRTLFHVCSVACSSTVSVVKRAKHHWLIRIGRDWEGTGHILVRGTVPSCLEGLRKNTKTFRIFGLAVAFEPMTLACKWEVLVLLQSCYVRLRTACYRLLIGREHRVTRTSRHCLTCLLNYNASYLSKRKHCNCYRSSKLITWSRVLSETLIVPLLSNNFF